MRFSNRSLHIIFFLILGVVLQMIAPPIGQIKPDFLLIFTILSLLCTRNILVAFLICAISAFVSMTLTIFPGGQIASWIDKFVIGFFVFFANQETSSKKRSIAKASILCFFSVLASGILFLSISCVIKSGNFSQWKSSLSMYFLSVIFPMALVGGLITIFFQKTIRPQKNRK